MALDRFLTDVSSPTSVSGRARARRWTTFRDRFPDIAEMRVLDLGGTPDAWRVAPVRPASVVTVNLLPLTSDDPTVTAVRGDGCALPGRLDGEQFDLVFSNSLLEHVGGHVPRCRLADTVHERAPRHWVQTPYRYFPAEPHWLVPGIQWLPWAARVQVTQRLRWGPMHSARRGQAVDNVNEVELVGYGQMRAYFPGSELWAERFAGLPKSLVAIQV